jgi:tRNA(adenine34) deaminase
VTRQTSRAIRRIVLRARLCRSARRRRVREMVDLRLHQPRHPDVTETDIAMMERAIELASKAAAIGEVPIGAVIYKGSNIIAEAFNLRESASDPTGHAELLAISKAGRTLGDWRLTDCTLAVTLEPCPMCAGALVNARLGRLIYGAADPKAGACHTLFQIPDDDRLNHRVTMIGGVLADRSRKLLQQFFRERRVVNRQDRAVRTA